ncbi:CRISPR-associated helicase Cas3' [Akkermansia glycaniphila]|uniref:CRISPR-associated helicase Cas3' n=1 Tax=Akkermansia glycaniphila TaxID=1679444 RepID=UPI00248AAD56|nr:CRISPR-associated helicase Cas3' [Akkermansia glycaniphila]
MYLARPGQSLVEHLEMCALHMGRLLECLGLKRVGEVCGWLHDFGKWAEAFAGYLNKVMSGDGSAVRGSVDHSTAGGQLIWRLLEERRDKRDGMRFFSQMIAQCVMSHHHGGLIDSWDDEKRSDVIKRLHKPECECHLEDARQAMGAAYEERLFDLLFSGDFEREVEAFHAKMQGLFGVPSSALEFQYGMVARMLLSALLDADYTSASGNVPGISVLPDWTGMLAKLEERLASFSRESELNRMRGEIADCCRASADAPLGKFSLTAPTGAGKTLSSLLFALTHAAKHGLDRIIYVIPYTSIIDQNYEEVRAILSDYAQCVLAHHANVVPEKGAGRGADAEWSADEKGWYERSILTWDVPIIFTTSVQFLNSCFKSGSQHVRRMHALKNSVLIFDEAQAIPLSSRYLFEGALDFLTGVCRCSTVCCTATLPQDVRSGYLSSRQEGAPPVAILPNAPRYAEAFLRLRQLKVEDFLDGGRTMDLDSLAELLRERAAEFGSVLMIANTKRCAKLLYQRCKELMGGAGTLCHLSTSLCAAHRRFLIENRIGKEAVRKAAKDGRPVVCISTQLVEAGVDIDFAVVVRSMCGLDSLVQSAGRCNRDARLDGGRLILVEPSGEVESLVNLDELVTAREAGESVYACWKDDANESSLLSSIWLAGYYRKFFQHSKVACKMNFPVSLNYAGSSDLVHLLSSNRQNRGKDAEGLALHQSFSMAGREYKAIADETTGVLVPYAEGQEVIRQMMALGKPSVWGEDQWKRWKELLKESQPFTVSLHNNLFSSLLTAGEICRINEEVDVYCALPNKYDSELGLLDAVGEVTGALMC